MTPGRARVLAVQGASVLALVAVWEAAARAGYDLFAIRPLLKEIHERRTG